MQKRDQVEMTDEQMKQSPPQSVVDAQKTIAAVLRTRGEVSKLPLRRRLLQQPSGATMFLHEQSKAFTQ